MPSFVCSSCGAEFTLPQAVLDRYPGWTPRSCMECRDKSASPGPSSGASRSRPKTSKPKRSATANNNLTLAEVLDRFADGPTDGVFTDGSSVPNPGPGGWGSVYVSKGEIVDQAFGHHEEETTNNRMELTAIIEGIKLVPAGEAAVVYTDSNLAARTINEWAEGWARNSWRRKNNAPVANLDLVQELYDLTKARPEITIRWIRAHSGSRWNEYADALSTAWQRDTL